MQAISIRVGKYVHVFALAKHNIIIYENELFDSINAPSQQKIAARIDFLANEQPPIRNDQICKKLKGCDNLYELKAKQIRLFFFIVGKRAIITHGYVKKSNSTDSQQIARAERLKQEFFS